MRLKKRFSSCTFIGTGDVVSITECVLPQGAKDAVHRNKAHEERGGGTIFGTGAAMRIVIRKEVCAS